MVQLRRKKCEKQTCLKQIKMFEWIPQRENYIFSVHAIHICRPKSVSVIGSNLFLSAIFEKQSNIFFNIYEQGCQHKEKSLRLIIVFVTILSKINECSSLSEYLRERFLQVDDGYEFVICWRISQSNNDMKFKWELSKDTSEFQLIDPIVCKYID